MAARSLFRLAAIAVLSLTAAACIYPYEVDIQSGGSLPLVVEGDISVGSVTTVYLSHVYPFDEFGSYHEPVRATGYIEGEDGTRVESSFSFDDFAEGTLRFDTSNLREGQRYRLHLETLPSSGDVNNVFESDWLDVCPAPTIDGLNYSHHPEYDELWIGLSMHYNGAHHFHWNFSEIWEYHSDIPTDLKFDLETWEMGYYAPDPSLYYCWKYADSPSINIFSTANQTEDRFEELAFHTIPLSDKRLQVMYKITVRLQAMSENAYNYWYNMQQNSEGQGSIFSPTPSEMASNVRCISDPSVQVLGYLNAAVVAEAELYYDNSENSFYKAQRPYETDEKKVSASRPDSLAYWVQHGHLPYVPVYEGLSADPSHYLFARAICIDCRKQGGVKDKPEDWPTYHR